MLRGIFTVLLCLAFAFVTAQPIQEGENDWMKDFAGFFDSAGSIGGSIGDWVDVFEDFSFDKFLGASCGTAGTVDQIDNSSDSAQAKSIVCGVAGALSGFFSGDMSVEGLITQACQAATKIDDIDEGQDDNPESEDIETAKTVACSVADLYKELEAIAEDNRVTVEEIGNRFFSEDTLANMGLGFLNSTQLQQFSTDLQAALYSKTPQQGLEAAEGIFRSIAQTEYENRQELAESTDTATGIAELSPMLQLGAVNDAKDIARNGMQQFQAMSNTKGSLDIAKNQLESTYPETLNETIQTAVGPMLRGKAETSVSTRATVQTVVESISHYMEQDSNQFAYLTQLLKQQTVQGVYSTSSLQLIASSFAEEQSRETRERSAAVRMAITNNTNTVQGMSDKLTGTLRSFKMAQGNHKKLPDVIY